MEKTFENFTVAILKLNKLVQKIKNYEMREYGLKTIHVMCLYYLDCYPDGLTAGELIEHTLEDKAAISRALKTLREKGYVSYDNKKYNTAIVLTESGKNLAGEVCDKATHAVDASSADFSDGERVFFYGSLSAISEKLENYYNRLVAGGKL